MAEQTEMQEVAKFGWDAAQARRAMNAVVPHTSSDRARPSLAAVLVDAKEDGTARVVGTDSYTLAVADLPPDFTQAGRWLIGRKGAVPRTGARAYDLGLYVNGTAGAWKTARYETPFELVEGQFPNWEQLMPEIGQGSILEPGNLASRLETVRDMGCAVVLHLGEDGKVGLTLQTEGWACETDTSAVWKGEAMRVGFSPAYLLRCLESCGPAIQVEIRDGLKPALFLGAGVKALCMPVWL